MPLHLAQHKSYHPYKKDNIERVRRDEEAARQAEEQGAQSTLVADSEARIETLRRQRQLREARDDPARLEARLKAAEAELDGKKDALKRFDEKRLESIGAEEASGSGGSGKGKQRETSIVDEAGHINFWQDVAKSGSSSLKRPRSPGAPGHPRPKRGNPEYEAELAATRAKEAADDGLNVYLSQPTKDLQPWYQSEDLQSGAEKRKSEEQKLDELYKDGKRKSAHDPMKVVNDGLREREEREREKQRMKEGMLRRWHGEASGSRRELSGSSTSTASDPLRAAAEAREASERARAEALIAAKRRERMGMFGEPLTPAQSERGIYSDQFNSDDVRAAQRAREERERRPQDFQVRHRDIDPGGGVMMEGEIDTVTAGGSPAEGERMLGSERAKDTGGSAIETAATAASGQTTDAVPSIAVDEAFIKKEDDDAERSPAAPALHQDERSVAMQRDPSDISVDSVISISSTSTDGTPKPRESMYPAILGEMISTVLGGEAYLFSPEEQSFMRGFKDMSYSARYLFSRLIQRKDAWLRLERLAYDARDCEDIPAAVKELSLPRIVSEQGARGTPAQEMRWCIGVEDMAGGEEEALELLNLDELKDLAKKMGRPAPSANRATIVKALLTSKSQSTLFSFTSPVKNVASPSKGSAPASPSPKKSKQLTLSFGPAANGGRKPSQAQLLRQRLAEIIGGCVRVAAEARALIDRIALVYYRGYELGSSALTTAVLARSRRRRYPSYAWSRSDSLFPSRTHLVDMEEALAMEAKMEELIEWDGSKEGFQEAFKLFETAWAKWISAVQEMRGREEAQIDKFQYHRMRFHPGWPLTRIVYKATTVLARFKMHDRESEVLEALLGQRFFRRGKRGDWHDRLALITGLYHSDAKKRKMLALEIAVKGIEDPDTHLIYQSPLQRRILRLENQLNLPFSLRHDFSYAQLSKPQERVFEGERLDAVVHESQVRTGLFGAKIPPMQSVSRAPSGSGSRRSSPVKRSASSSNLVGTPKRSDSSGSIEAATPDAPAQEVEELGAAFSRRAPVRKIVKLDKGKGTPKKEEGGDVKVETSRSASAAPDSAVPKASRQQEHSINSVRSEMRTSLATVWRGLDDEPCRVEELVLQHYALEGYKGYHDEGGVLKMLFALCMWDIIFHPVEGAFETQYQSAPLDLGEDSFAIARAALIRTRLSEIEETGGLSLIASTDARERPQRTWAVACRWDAYPLPHLLEIAHCMGGKGLATVCQMMCEEWGHCSSGMPDLVVWRVEQGGGEAEVKKEEQEQDGSLEEQKAEVPPRPEEFLAFLKDRKGSVRWCEVKSPTDRLSEKQKVWIDVLCKAGLNVELGLVREGK